MEEKIHQQVAGEHMYWKHLHFAWNTLYMLFKNKHNYMVDIKSDSFIHDNP